MCFSSHFSCEMFDSQIREVLSFKLLIWLIITRNNGSMVILWSTHLKCKFQDRRTFTIKSLVCLENKEITHLDHAIFSNKVNWNKRDDIFIFKINIHSLCGRGLIYSLSSFFFQNSSKTSKSMLVPPKAVLQLKSIFNTFSYNLVCRKDNLT